MDLFVTGQAWIASPLRQAQGRLSGDGYVVLTGKLLEEFGATPIQGWDEITIVPPEE